MQADHIKSIVWHCAYLPVKLFQCFLYRWPPSIMTFIATLACQDYYWDTVISTNPECATPFPKTMPNKYSALLRVCCLAWTNKIQSRIASNCENTFAACRTLYMQHHVCLPRNNKKLPAQLWFCLNCSPVEMQWSLLAGPTVFCTAQSVGDKNYTIYICTIC